MDPSHRHMAWEGRRRQGTASCEIAGCANARAPRCYRSRAPRARSRVLVNRSVKNIAPPNFMASPPSISAPGFRQLRRVRLCWRATVPMIGNRIGTAGVHRTIGYGRHAMPDDILPFDKTAEPGLSRRSFAFALGAGAAVTASAAAADNPVVETDVMIKMMDGDC